MSYSHSIGDQETGAADSQTDRGVAEPILDLRPEVIYYSPALWTTQSRYRFKYARGSAARSSLIPLKRNRLLLDSFLGCHFNVLLVLGLMLLFPGIIAAVTFFELHPASYVLGVGVLVSLSMLATFSIWYIGLMLHRRSMRLKCGIVPDSIQISPTSLSLSWHAFGISVRSTPISLKQISLVHLERHSDPVTLENHDLLSIRTFTGAALLLDSRDFESPEDFKLFIDMLGRHARQAIASPAFALAIQPAQRSAIGYRHDWSWELGIGSGLLRRPRHPGPDNVLPAGTRLKNQRYEILEHSGSTMSGVTYLARVHDAQLEDGSQVTLLGVKDDSKPISLDAIRTVAIRQFIFPPDRSRRAERLLCRFEDEVRGSSAYTGAGIARWLDVFVEQGRTFVVYEHVSGRGLREHVLDNQPLPVADALDILVSLCDIVISLHGTQLTARSMEGPCEIRPGFGYLSPDSFAITESGAPKMIEHPIMTKIPSMGNLCPGLAFAYASPERLTGAIVRQSDVYSLGAILYFLLTGSDPTPGAVPPPSLLNTSIGSELDELVARMTHVDVEERMQEGEEVKYALLEARAAAEGKRLTVER